MSDNRLQEIVTRAVVGRAESTLTWSHKMAASDLEHVLGVRVNKTDVAVTTKNGQPVVELTVKSDLWCSCGEETKVLHIRSHCAQDVAVHLDGELLSEVETSATLISGPRSTGVHLEGDAIYIDFEAAVHIEVFALTRIWIEAYELDLSPSGDDWDISAPPKGDSRSRYGSH